MKETSLYKAEKYVRMADKIRILLENQLGIEVPEHVFQSWQITFEAIHLVDHVLDNSNDMYERQLISESLLELISGNDEIEMEDEQLRSTVKSLRESLSQYPQKQRGRFIKKLKLISRVTERIKQETRPSKFARFTRLEGQLTNELLLTLLPEEIVRDSRFRPAARSLKNFIRMANLADSIVDIGEDFTSDQIKIDPTIVNRLKVSSGFINRDFLRAAPVLANPKTWRIIYKGLLFANNSKRL